MVPTFLFTIVGVKEFSDGNVNKNKDPVSKSAFGKSLRYTSEFIPSTLNGSCMQSSNGKVNEQKLKENLSDAIDVYISRVNKCSCGDTVIHLYKGTDSSDNQDIRKMVKTFFSGTTDDVSQLKEQHPNEYKWIESICELQKRLMISGLPSKYVFHLKLYFNMKAKKSLDKLSYVAC